MGSAVGVAVGVGAVVGVRLGDELAGAVVSETDVPVAVGDAVWVAALPLPQAPTTISNKIAETAASETSASRILTTLESPIS